MRIHLFVLLEPECITFIGKIFKSNTVMKNLKLFVILSCLFISELIVWQKSRFSKYIRGESMILLVGMIKDLLCGRRGKMIRYFKLGDVENL